MNKRPRYETAEDRKKELDTAKKFCDFLPGISTRKLEKESRADFSIIKEGKEVGYLEIKNRTCDSTKYATYHVSKDKLDALSSMAKKENKGAYLAVQWQDRAGCISVDKFLKNATYKIGGRMDRGDKFDQEKMAEIDVKMFTFLD